MSFSRRSFFSALISLAILSLLTTFFIFLSAHNNPQHDPQVVGDSSLDSIWKQSLEWSELLERRKESGNLPPSALLAIDFSFPGDLGFGDDPSHEFFNPDGPFKAMPPNQQVLGKLAGSGTGRPTFKTRQIRAISQAGHGPTAGIEYRIWLVIPDVKLRCKFVRDYSSELYVTLNLSLEEDGHFISDSDLSIEGCLQSNDQTILAKEIFVGLKSPTQDIWLSSYEQ